MTGIQLRDDILKGWTVLVIDDEPDNLLVAQTLLEMCGAAVLEAENGKVGLEKVRDHRPSFIICDISMPEMSGWDFIEAMRKDRSYDEIPAIALTAHAMPGDRTKAIAAGFHNYLSKPLVPETFINDLLLLLVDIPHFAASFGAAQ